MHQPADVRGLFAVCSPYDRNRTGIFFCLSASPLNENSSYASFFFQVAWIKLHVFTMDVDAKQQNTETDMFKQSPKQAAVNHTRRNVRIGTDVTIDFGKYSAKYHIDGVVGKVVDLLNIVNGTPLLYAVQYTDSFGKLMTCDCPAWAITKWTRRIAD